MRDAHLPDAGVPAGRDGKDDATMLFRAASDAVLLIHLGFIVFVMLGALLAVRWRPLLVLHIGAVAWATFVEASGALCPLTYVENRLRSLAGASGYAGGFVDHYLVALIYPAGLTRTAQFLLALLVIVVNAAIYWRLLREPRVRMGIRRPSPPIARR